QGNSQVQFVPIDVTKNLATPLPAVMVPQPKGSYFDRLYDSLASVLPFPRRNRKPYLPAPLAPTMQLPKSSQTQLPPPAQSTVKLPSFLTSPLISGGAK